MRMRVYVYVYVCMYVCVGLGVVHTARLRARLLLREPHRSVQCIGRVLASQYRENTLKSLSMCERVQQCTLHRGMQENRGHHRV